MTSMSKAEKKTPSFEEAMKRLDEIVQAMERGEIGIEESIARYEEAMKLAAQCRAILHDAEQRIRKIQVDAQGRPTSTPIGGLAPDGPEQP